MLDVHQEADFATTADAVWHVVGSFTGMGVALGLDMTSDGDAVGALRTVSGDRGVMVERLDILDDVARTLTYTLTRPGPMPVHGYRSTIGVTATGPTTCRLHWTASFAAAEGTTDAKAEALIAGIYTSTIAKLRELFDPVTAG